MDPHTLYELIGYIASALVAVSLTMKRILYLRTINLIGAIAFVIYGAVIGAYPVAVVNSLIVIINLYYLYQQLNTHEFFRLLELAPDDRYLHEFLSFHGEDIAELMPDFNFQPRHDTLVLLVLRNMHPSGIFIGHQEQDQFCIELDYVIPGYRDFKSAQFIFRDSRELFAQRGIHKLITSAERKMHANYLKRIGFQTIGNPKVMSHPLAPQFVLEI